MDDKTLSLQMRPRYITGLTDNIQKYFEQETGVKYSSEVIDDALSTWLESRFDQMVEGIGEVITSPHLAESQHFRQILESIAAESATVAAAQPAVVTVADTGTVFTGARAFSPEKLGAMIEYIAAKGRDIYKTNLNKLLFYGDLTHYYLYGRGISGATYVNLPFGPVPDKIESVIEDLATEHRISRVDVPYLNANAQIIKPASGGGTNTTLDPDEIELLNWVLDTYGHMTPGEITDFSHLEKAYKFTRPQEPIAYEYAKFFTKLPPRGQGQ